MAIVKLSDLSIADLKAALEFADEQTKFWEKFDTDPNTEREKEIQENFNCWTNRAEVIEEEIFNKFNEIFIEWTEELRVK